MRPLADVRDEGQVGILIELREDDPLEPGAFGKARALIEASPGRGPLYLDVKAGRSRGNGGANGDLGGSEGDGRPSRFRSATLRVAPTPSLVEELRALLGGSGVRLVRGR